MGPAVAQPISDSVAARAASVTLATSASVAAKKGGVGVAISESASNPSACSQEPKRQPQLFACRSVQSVHPGRNPPLDRQQISNGIFAAKMESSHDDDRLS